MNVFYAVVALFLISGSVYAYRTSSPYGTGQVAASTAAVSMAASTVMNQQSKANNGAIKEEEFTTTPSGLKYKVIQEGTGAIPQKGQRVQAHYTGWLFQFESERKFDSSRDRNRPFTFKVGAGQVIRGWDEAFGEMKVGERRLLIIPSGLAYGDSGVGNGLIPPKSTLYFDVELLSIQ